MTIAKRLILLIAASFGSALLLGVFALWQIKQIGDGGEYFYVNTLPSYDALYTSEARLHEIRALAGEHILSADAGMMADTEQALVAARKDLLGQLNHYGKDLLTDAEDVALWTAASQAVKTYLKAIDNALALSRAGQKEAAHDALMNSAGMHRQALQTLEADLAFNTRVADHFIASYKQSFAWAIVMMAGLLVFAGVVCIGLGAWIYRSTIGSLREMRTTLVSIAQERDFTLRATPRSNDEVGETMVAFNQLIQRVQESFVHIRDRAGKVTSASSDLAAAASQLSISSTQQSEAASGMAATVEEMTVSISHVADQTGEAHRLSEQSGQLANAGTTVINRTVEDIHRIAQTVQMASGDIAQLEKNSEQISAVVAVIREVAEQTNLLALNAAIEAARAGEQGRGFAVVADEVRKLAERTTNSTREISQSIEDMQISAQSAVKGMAGVTEHVASGVTQAKGANEAMGRIGQGALQAAEMVSDISLAMREQSMASTNIAQQVERIAQMTEENSAAAGAAAETAQALDALAAEMHQVVAQFRV